LWGYGPSPGVWKTEVLQWGPGVKTEAPVVGLVMSPRSLKLKLKQFGDIV